MGNYTVQYTDLDPRQLVFKIQREHAHALLWDDKNYNRSVENWRFYWGLDAEKGLGQYPDSVVNDLVREGRHIATYNLTRPTVDNLAGGIMKTPYSVDFSPIDSPVSSLTYAIKNLFMADKELLDWDTHYLCAVIGGLIYEGVMEMYISREYNRRRGNIGMRFKLPGTVLFDPLWKTPARKDCKRAWVSAWLTPQQMLEIYGEKSGEQIEKAVFKMLRAKQQNPGAGYLLNQLAEQQRQQGDTFGDNRGVYPYSPYDDIWGTQMRVIQFYHIQRIKTKFEFAVMPRSEMHPDGRAILPRNLETPADKIEWLNVNAPDWQPDGVFEDEDYEDIQFCTPICPALSLSLILDNAPTEVQCGGLQFFPWSAARMNGEKSGVVDLTKDTQRNINYWESIITNKIQTEGGGGSQFFDPAAFDSENTIQDYVHNSNNPRKKFRLKPGAGRQYPNGPAIPTVKSGFPAEVSSHLEHLIDVMWSRVSKVTPASRGISESSTESGILYKLKKLQSDIEQYTMYRSLQNWWADVGDAYLYQGIRTYSGEQREIYNPGTKSSFTINERRYEDGMMVIVNDISRLRDIRHKVAVIESEDAPTRKIEVMQVAGELVGKLPQTQKITATKMGALLVRSLDSWSPEEKQEIDEDSKLEVELARAETKALIAELSLREMSAKAQIAAAQAQAQAQAMQPSMVPPNQVTGSAPPAPPQPGPAQRRPELPMNSVRQDMAQAIA